MATEQEKLRHEAIKKLLQQAVQENQSLMPIQKQMIIARIEEAAIKADWVMEMLEMCGYL